MPKIHYVKRARKHRPKFGIRRGEPYYWWWLRFTHLGRGVKQYSKLPPKSWQTTSSPYWRQVLKIQEEVETAAALMSCRGMAALEDACNGAADELECLAGDLRARKDNMPDSLQRGPTGELLEARTDACEQVASALRDAALRLAGLNEDKDDDLAEAEGIMADIEWSFE
jgi:hypothetical protein